MRLFNTPSKPAALPRHFAAMLALTFFAASGGAAGLSFDDGTFADADWAVVNSFQYDASHSGQQPSGGNPGAYRGASVAVAQNVGFVGTVNNAFTVDPVQQGGIQGLVFSMDLRTANAAGATYSALLRQGTHYYVDSFQTETFNGASNTWLRQTRQLDLTHFAELTIDTSHLFPTLVVNTALHPDFSIIGAPIAFGYEITAGGGGFFASVTGLDNLHIEVALAAVPEPGSHWTALAGLLAVVAQSRRRLCGSASEAGA